MGVVKLELSASADICREPLHRRAGAVKVPTTSEEAEAFMEAIIASGRVGPFSPHDPERLCLVSAVKPGAGAAGSGLSRFAPHCLVMA